MKMRRKPRPLSRADARTLLAELRSDLWLWRLARMTSARRSLAMRVRWRLRWLAQTPEHLEALAAVDLAMAARRRCGACGQLVQRHTRLGRQHRRRLEA